MTAIPPSMPASTANWHWKNKTVTPWAKTWFERELTSIAVKGDDTEEVSVTHVTEVDGDVELGQRKSKLITIYDCKVVLEWKGIASDGTEVSGKLTIPEVSHEVTLDGLSDYVYEWSLTTARSPAVDAVFALAKARLPAALEEKFAAFPAAIVDTHGRDLTVSAEVSRTGTPAPPSGSGASTPALAKPAATTKKAEERKAEKVNTTTVTVEANFMAAADDLFGLLTEEKRIPAWTRAPAKSAAQAGTEYSLFGGGVKGKFISLSPPKEFVQTWALSSPTWPTGHEATLTTTLEQSSDSTKITWSLQGVPLGLEDEINTNLQGYYVHGLKAIGPISCIAMNKASFGIYDALVNFLAAGTLSLPLSGAPPLFGGPAQDGWPKFPGCAPFEQLFVNEADSSLGKMLDFLVLRHFIAATCQCAVEASTGSHVLILRIYLIPWDLPNTQGALHRRDEASVLKPARRYLKALLTRVVQEEAAWGGCARQASSSRPPKTFLDQSVDNRTLLEIYNDLPSPTATGESLEVPALRSTLYPYQRRTVATMLARELNSGTIPNPLFIEIFGINGTVFFLQPATMEILREAPQMVPTRGGILCEELGTGKTVMMLALILATLDQLPAPEESFIDERPVMTPLSFRHFRTGASLAAEHQLARGRRKSKREKDRESYRVSADFPSLVEIILHYCRTMPDGLDLRGYQERLEQRNLWSPLMANVPYYLHYKEVPNDRRSQRHQEHPGPKTMYLSAATLVVVPDNLLTQWTNEINKHCLDVLRVLVLNDAKQELMDAPVLASSFDIILMTHSRFGREEQKNRTDSLHSWTSCKCPGSWATRVPKCRCNSHADVSQLLQIRFKRLVVDEGHIASSRNSAFSHFAQCLSVERRWIMTGTPTTNLLGLAFGQGSELQYPSEDEPEDQSPRKWDYSERADLRKLGTMMADFLGVPIFAAEATFTRCVVAPLFEPSCPGPGAIQVLTQVMGSTMVRHRIEDVEVDCTLPLLSHETVLLDLDLYAVKTYNAMQAAIAINAVDSERKDQVRLNSLVPYKPTNLRQDYLFHPRNTGQLRRLVGSISHVMFWHVDDNLFRVDEVLKNAEKALETALKRQKGSEDIELIQQSITHLKFLMSAPTASLARIVSFGDDVKEEERKREELSRALQRRKKKGSRAAKDADADVQNAHDSVGRATSQEKLEEMRRELQAAEARVNASFDSVLSSRRRQDRGTTSSKLDYMLNEILQHSSEEKFLIFSASVSTLAFIAEALDVIRVKYLEYNSLLRRHFRQDVVTTFETSDLYRVLLMELKHGARGLNLVSASRVIFCEPVWQADVESQAIKRVHRIGQTRLVTVKTLAIRSTSEEVMVTRRDALRGTKEELTNEPTDDRTVRDFIEHPTFLTETASARPKAIDVPLLDTKILRLRQLEPRGAIDVVANIPQDSPSHDRTSSTHEGPPKKRVRFTEV
ncbi:hypothetical protein A0H81_10948 [Grifola frondosa]|uniref:Uncharacterized protein n=1 Tax=Grifola frondosa TaxID=5627 RepID=A0A1C7LX97_GRIFR|nr:hypothetical protein A0H81_10948 [Grifola frondosa]